MGGSLMRNLLTACVFSCVVAALGAAGRAGAGAVVGSQAPDLIVRSQRNERPINLRNLRGNVVILLFYRTSAIQDAGLGGC